MDLKKLKKIAIEYNALETDDGRIRYLINNNDLYLRLDNDQTNTDFTCDHDYDEDVWQAFVDANELRSLDNYLGDSDGVGNLLDIMKVPYEYE